GSSHGLVVRDARRCRAPHHEGLRPHPRDERNCVHPWERALARVSKDEAHELENALAPLSRCIRGTRVRTACDKPQIRSAQLPCCKVAAPFGWSRGFANT